METQAYKDGLKSGHADRLLGRLSRYAFYGVTLEQEGSYTFEYSQGYRKSVLGY